MWSHLVGISLPTATICHSRELSRCHLPKCCLLQTVQTMVINLDLSTWWTVPCTCCATAGSYLKCNCSNYGQAVFMNVQNLTKNLTLLRAGVPVYICNAPLVLWKATYWLTRPIVNKWQTWAWCCALNPWVVAIGITMRTEKIGTPLQLGSTERHGIHAQELRSVCASLFVFHASRPS